VFVENLQYKYTFCICQIYQTQSQIFASSPCWCSRPTNFFFYLQDNYFIWLSVFTSCRLTYRINVLQSTDCFFVRQTASKDCYQIKQEYCLMCTHAYDRYAHQNQYSHSPYKPYRPNSATSYRDKAPFSKYVIPQITITFLIKYYFWNGNV
jgi:hypothetical protein